MEAWERKVAEARREEEEEEEATGRCISTKGAINPVRLTTLQCRYNVDRSDHALQGMPDRRAVLPS